MKFSCASGSIHTYYQPSHLVVSKVHSCLSAYMLADMLLEIQKYVFLPSKASILGVLDNDSRDIVNDATVSPSFK